MPDKIKDAYSAVKSTGLFIDEADFRAQIAKDKKAVFELFNSEKSTKGLFIDEADFDAQLGLGKQPASPSGNGGASSSAQSTPPVTPSTPSGNPLKIGLYREEPTSQRVVPQQKQLNVGLEDFKEGTPKAPKVVSSKEAMKGIDVPKQTFKEAAKSMEDPTLEQAMTQKEWEEIKKNPTVVERIEGMANEFYEKEPARIQQDIYDRAADNFGAMSKTPMTEISAAYNNATKFNDESAKQYLQGLKKNLVGDYLTYLDKADPERSSDIKARISEIETKLGVPNVEEEKFLYDLEKEALQLKANYANREAKKAMYSMDYDAYSVDATMYEEKIKSLKAKRDKYVNPDGSPKNSLGNKYQEYNSQMGALNKEIEDISAEFSSYVGEDGVLKDESKRGYVEGLQQRATALEAQANDLQKNYSYLFENGKLKQTEEEKKALVIDNQLNQVIEQYNALGEKYGVSQDKLNVINNAATFNSQINGILTDGLKEYKGLYEAIKKGEEQTARGLEFTEESGEVKEAVAAGIIATGQALETAGLNIKQLPKIVLGVVKKDLGIPFVDQTGMLDYLFTDWLDDAVNRQFEQNYEKLEYGENVEIPYFVKKAELFGSGIGSLMSFMAGGEVLAITKIPRLMSLWGTAFVIQEGNNYQEALRNGLSPTEARLYSSAISGISATIELAVPDFRYLDGVVRASILQSIKKGASVQDAIKQGLKAMPQSLKAYSKHMLQEGAEEGAENIGVDVTKSILNYAEEKEIYKDLFKADALFDAITAGAMVGGAMTAISRPDQKSPTQQSLIGAISETTEEDVLQVSTIAPENAAVIAEIQGIGAGMRQLPSFTALNQTEKNFVISESFRKKQLQRAQKEAGVKDPNIQAEIDKIDSDIEAVFSGKKVGETYEAEAGADEKVTNVVGNELINENVVEQRDFTSQMLNPSLFEDVGIFSNELGGSGVNSVVSNHNIVDGIDVVEFSNPNTGVVDIVVSGVSGRDFVGFYRLYENGKPTNKWSSKFENQSRNKGNFKTMISEVQARLPEGHEYTEKTSISTDGLRVWEQQLSRGYDLQYDENGKLKTNRVAINGDAIVNELGIDVKAGDFDVIEVKNNQEFDIVRQALTPYMESLGLDSSNIYWRNGTVEVDLPILARGKKSNAAQTAEVTQENIPPVTEATNKSTQSLSKNEFEAKKEKIEERYKNEMSFFTNENVKNDNDGKGDYVDFSFGRKYKDEITNNYRAEIIEARRKEALLNNKLDNNEASRKLAEIAKNEGINLVELTREEYVDYAIKHGLRITDQEIRNAPELRAPTTMDETMALRKSLRENLSEKTKDLWNKWTNSIELLASKSQAERYILKGVRVLSYTANSASWLFFDINNSQVDSSKAPYKSYFSLKDFNKITPENFVSFMKHLQENGYKGSIKSFQDLVNQGVILNDQFVMHGDTKQDAELGEKLAKEFFKDEIKSTGLGKDGFENGKSKSYSQILADKINSETSNDKINAKYDAELAALEQAQKVPIVESTQEGIKEGAVEEIVPEGVSPSVSFELPQLEIQTKPNSFDKPLLKLGYKQEDIDKMSMEQKQEIVINKTEAPVVESTAKVDSVKENARAKRLAEINAELDKQEAEGAKAEPLSEITQGVEQMEQPQESVGEDATTKQQIENFGVNKADVEPVHSVISQVFNGLKKAGLTAAKTVGDWVGIGKGSEKPYSLKINGKDVQVKNTSPDVVNGFYSPLEAIINSVKQDKMPAKQWAEKFAKGEEAKWTGLTDWLAQQEGSVSKADIQQFLKDNRIEIVEVVKGMDDNQQIKRGEEIKQAFIDEGYEIATGMDGEIEVTKDGEYVEDIESDLPKNLYNLALEYYDLKNSDGILPTNATKFSQYQLEGEKENYKEVLVTMPSKNLTKPKDARYKELIAEQNRLEKEYNKYDDLSYSRDEKIAKEATTKREEISLEMGGISQELDTYTPIKENTKFKSSHFEEPNILVHLRMNTRTDAQGKKVLFLEEVQSDWGQQGKKVGFAGNDIFTAKQKSDGSWDVFQKAEFKKNVFANNEKEAIKTAGYNPDFTGTPTAPFVMDTNAWTKLGLKVALKEAVAQGVDKIAWTTGEQQNERYDLRKQVDNINYLRNEDGTYQVYGKKDGNIVFKEKALAENQLESSFGKDVAEKIINDKGRVQEGLATKVLEGDNLAVGGKGMKGFYGSTTEGSLGIVGNVAKSLTKQEPKTTKIDIGKEYVRSWDNAKAQGFKIIKKSEYKNASSYTKDFVIVDKDGDAVTSSDTEQGVIEVFLKTSNSADVEQRKVVEQYSIDITPELKASVEGGQPLFKDAEAQYRIESGKNIVEAIRDFNGSPRATIALTHEIMHPTVVAIIDGAKEGNEVGLKHTQTIVDEFNKANPKNQVTVEQLIEGNDAFKDGTTSKKYRAVQEFIAKSWEKYHLEGKQGFSKAFQDVLDQITKAFQSVYKSLSGKQLTPELRKMFDEILGKETTQALETETKIESIVSEALSELNIVKEQTPAKKQKKESKTAARKRFREATLGFEPSDPDKAVETYIRQYFSGGGKVDTESLIRELGLRGRNRELRGKIGLHQKGKPSIERLSEIIHERLTEEQQEMIYQPDIRSIIIDILQSESKLDMRINLEEDYLAETEVDMMGMTPQQYQDYKRHERDAEAFYEEMQLEEAQKQEAYDELFSPEVIDALMDIDEMSIEEIETKYGDAIDADGNIDEVKLNELISNEQGTKNQEGTKENISKEGGRENQKPATEEVAILEVFDTIENAQRTKKTVKGKKEAMEEAVKEYGEVGEKAIFVESNFKDIIESLKEVKDAKGNNILKVKC